MFAPNKKIKVLYIYPSLRIGGAEELRFLALKNMKNRECYDIKICCIEEIGEIGEKIRGLGIEVFCLNKSSKPYNLEATFSLIRYLLKNKFDIVHTSLFNSNFHGRISAFLTGVPIVISEEHSEHYQYRSLKFLPYIWSDRILSIFTDKIICCSRNLMNSIAKLEKIPSDKLFLLLNTFNAEKLKIKLEKGYVKKEVGVSNGDLIIGNVASLSPRKGQDILIKAFKLVKAKIPDAKLILIGGADIKFKEKLVRLVKKLGLDNEVLFLGKKENIADYLNIIDIIVLSSLFEGIPLVLLESMHMQVPVIATDTGGISEVIVNNQNGVLVKVNDVESLAAETVRLLKNKEERLRLANEAARTVAERFNSDRYVNKLDELYTELYRAKNDKLHR